MRVKLGLRLTPRSTGGTIFSRRLLVDLEWCKIRGARRLIRPNRRETFGRTESAKISIMLRRIGLSEKGVDVLRAQIDRHSRGRESDRNLLNCEISRNLLINELHGREIYPLKKEMIFG
jgi:hypothetical protein